MAEGGPDFDDQEDFQLSRAESSERFGPAMSEAAIDMTIRQRVPEKTRKATQWAVSVFRAWCDVRGVKEPLEQLPDDTLAELLPGFALEARRQDQSPYPPNTLVQIITGLQRHLREKGRPEIAILSQKDARFARTRNALDARMKQLTRDGVGTETKQAQPLSEAQKQSLWDLGVFSTTNAWGLTYAVFWYNCKMFGLQGGDEHRSLVREQFEVDSDDQGRYLHFKGRGSKNVQGGLNQRKVQFKDLKIYARPDLGDRCAVDLFNLYFAYIPATGPFYRKPIANDPPKYSKQVIGKNKLSGLVKEMCTRAGMSGNFTNHSGKVTCATRLFTHNVDEQSIMRQTGHRSTAVRRYKRPDAKHASMVSDILQPPPSKLSKLELSTEPPSQDVGTADQLNPEVRRKPPLQDCVNSQPNLKQAELEVCWKPPPLPSLQENRPPQPEMQTCLPSGIVLNFNFGKQ